MESIRKMEIGTGALLVVGAVALTVITAIALAVIFAPPFFATALLAGCAVYLAGGCGAGAVLSVALGILLLKKKEDTPSEAHSKNSLGNAQQTETFKLNPTSNDPSTKKYVTAFNSYFLIVGDYITEDTYSDFESLYFQQLNRDPTILDEIMTKMDNECANPHKDLDGSLQISAYRENFITILNELKRV